LTSLIFPNLEYASSIDCSNNLLTSFDYPPLSVVYDLNCSFNELESLTINNSDLMNLNCSNNKLSSLNLFGSSYLMQLDCSFNELEILNVATLTMLSELDCSENLLTSLDVSDNSEIWFLTARNNLLVEFNNANNSFYYPIYDLRGNSFTEFNSSMDPIGSTELDLSDCLQLEYINLRDGADNTFLRAENCPLLKYVCLDENEFYLNVDIGVEVNSECTTGDDWFSRTIEGRCVLDDDIDGCDGNDAGLEGIEIRFWHPQDSAIVVTDSNGDFSYDGLQISYDIQINNLDSENFVASPDFYFDFPGSVTDNTFCVSPNPYIAISTHIDADNNGCSTDEIGLPNLEFELVAAMVLIPLSLQLPQQKLC